MLAFYNMEEALLPLRLKGNMMANVSVRPLLSNEIPEGIRRDNPELDSAFGQYYSSTCAYHDGGMVARLLVTLEANKAGLPSAFASIVAVWQARAINDQVFNPCVGKVTCSHSSANQQGKRPSPTLTYSVTR